MDGGKIEIILIFTSILISFLAIGIIFENIVLNRILKSIKKDSNFAELKVILSHHLLLMLLQLVGHHLTQQ
jgi:hypothetical protein